MTELTTIDTNNYAEMAKAMGMATEASSAKKQGMFLARFRINHSAIMGMADVNGKKVNMEVVPGGTYKLEIPDGPTYYAESAIIRPFMQRFMYKKFVMGNAGTPNRYVKTVMADNLNIDLKDNDGGFNCGKPSGWIEDYKSLPEATKDLIKSIKRVRVVLGTVELVNPTDANGKAVEVDVTPIIWEVENRDAFKTVGGIFTKLGKMKRLPVQHNVTLNTDEQKLPNGNSFYLPRVSLDVTNTIELTQQDQERFGEFMSWVQNYNEYIINTYAEKAISKNDDDLDDVDVSGIVDVEIEEEVA
tara:strand:+ start:525 stop:1427 length:903 start_codon:yes stop_codon:yes gene_type:complete